MIGRGSTRYYRTLAWTVKEDVATSFEAATVFAEVSEETL